MLISIENIGQLRVVFFNKNNRKLGQEKSNQFFFGDDVLKSLPLLTQLRQSADVVHNNDIIQAVARYSGHNKRTLDERMCKHFRYVTQHNSSQEDHQVLVNIRLHVLQFGQRDPDSVESLRIRLEIEQLWIQRLCSTTPMGLNIFD